MEKHENLVASIGIKFSTDQDELEDFIQEVFIQSYQSLSQFRGESQFSTWLYQIARNHAVKFFKNQNSIQINDHSTFDQLKLSSEVRERTESSSQETQLFQDEIQNTIRKLVSKLPAQYKKPIVMFYFDNKSYKEISEKLNLKINTLKSTIFRGKEILKGMLKQDVE